MFDDTLIRYDAIRRADKLDDQKTALQILGAEGVSVTQEDLQEFVLSQIKRIIFLDDVGEWNTDFGAVLIRSLKQLSDAIGFTELQCACESTDVVGDCVYVSGLPVGGLPKVSRCSILDTAKMPSIGILSRKISDTVCFVRVGGYVDYPDALTPGLKYWVSSSGRLTAVPPNPATSYLYLQMMGVALTGSVFLIQLSLPIRRVSDSLILRKAIRVGVDGLLEEFEVREGDRSNIPLIGAYDGSNRDFLIPEPALSSPPEFVVKVYHGGRRLDPYEYQVLETTPGSGVFDLVRLTSWAPRSGNRLVADYVAA